MKQSTNRSFKSNFFLIILILSLFSGACAEELETTTIDPPANTTRPLPLSTSSDNATLTTVSSTIPNNSSHDGPIATSTTSVPILQDNKTSASTEIVSTTTAITYFTENATSVSTDSKISLPSSNLSTLETTTLNSSTSVKVEISSITTPFSSSIPTSTEGGSTLTTIEPSTVMVPAATETLTDDPYTNARNAGLSSFFSLIILIGIVGYGLWHFRKYQIKEALYGPSFRQFGSLALNPSNSPLPQRSSRSFRFAMGPTNNSTFEIRARDELQRRENDPGLGQSSSRSVESFDPFDPRSRDQESEGQFVNRIDNVMLS